jgi:hypothetical protein
MYVYKKFINKIVPDGIFVELVNNNYFRKDQLFDMNLKFTLENTDVINCSMENHCKDDIYKALNSC